MDGMFLKSWRSEISDSVDVWTHANKGMSIDAEKIAVVDGENLVSYGHLKQRVLNVSSLMSSCGVRYGARIAVMMRNSLACMEIHLAAALSCVSVVNINVNSTSEELARLLEDSSPFIVFADAGLSPKVLGAFRGMCVTDNCRGNFAKRVVWNGDGVSAALHGMKQTRVSSWISYFSHSKGTSRSHNIAAAMKRVRMMNYLRHMSEYQVYYTSGTTSVPKMVCFPQEKVAAHALAMIQECNISREDVWGHVSPMFHLVDAFAIFAVTFAGARHVVFPHVADAASLLCQIERERVTVTNIAATLFALLVLNPAIKFLDLSSLRLISCGGASIPAMSFRKAMSMLGCRAFNSYGMTETCGKIAMSLIEFPRHADEKYSEYLLKVCSAGRFFKLLDVRMVDENGIDVQLFRSGVILCKGRSVFDGYCNGRRSLVRHGIVDHAWFNTGDVASAQSQEHIAIKDRQKDVIISRSETIYSLEIEEIVSQHPSILQCAVFGTPDENLGEIVSVVVKPNNGGNLPQCVTKLQIDEVYNHCINHLSDYKVPRVIYVVEKIPTNSTGKFLKRTLKSMFPWPQVHGLCSISENFGGYIGMRALLHDIGNDGYACTLWKSCQRQKSMIVFDSEILQKYMSVISLSACDSKIVILIHEHEDVSDVEKIARQLADLGAVVSIVRSSTPPGELFSLGLSMRYDVVFCLGESATGNNSPPLKADLSDVIHEVFKVLGDIGMDEDPMEMCIDESLAMRGVTSSHSAIISE